MAKPTTKRLSAEREVATRTARAAQAGAAQLARAGFGDAAEGLAAVGALARDVANSQPGWSDALAAPFFDRRGKRTH